MSIFQDDPAGRQQSAHAVVQLGRRSVTIVRFVREQWVRHGPILLITGAVYMAITCFFRLRYAFLALTSIPEEGLDLVSRYGEVHRWFAGRAPRSALAAS